MSKSISGSKRIHIYLKCRGVCYICNEPLLFSQMTVDHVIARCLGGNNCRENLMASCQKCNTSKSTLENFIHCNKKNRRNLISFIRYALHRNFDKEL